MSQTSAPQPHAPRRSVTGAAKAAGSLALCGLVVLGLMASGAGADPAAPPSVGSERLVSSSASGGFCPAGQVEFSGVVAFTAAGTATGPYAGPFTEAGSITFTLGEVTAAAATATVTSPAGTLAITLSAPRILTLGCGMDNIGIGLAFSTTITTPTGGEYSDPGSGYLLLTSNPEVISFDVIAPLRPPIPLPGSPTTTAPGGIPTSVPGLPTTTVPGGTTTTLPGPPPNLPESPLVIGLPIAAVTLGLVVAARRRARRSH